MSKASSVLKSGVDQRDKAIDELRIERDRFKHDSEALAEVIGVVREAGVWHSSRDMGRIADILVDYLDMQEVRRCGVSYRRSGD